MTHSLARTATLAALAALSACQPSPSPAPSAFSIPTPTPGAFNLGSVPTLDWTEEHLPNDGDPSGAARVVAAPDGFVIFGGIGERALAWWSADGASWEASVLPGPEWPWSGASTADATVLIGTGSTNQCAHPLGEFLWRRGRGDASFAAVPFDEDLFCAGGTFSIAASEDAFVVAGRATGEQPFAWRSADGLRWVDASNGLTFDAPPEVLARTPDGFLELGYGPITDIRLLGSDGWTRVAPPPVAPASEGMQPRILLSTGAGAVAVFQNEDGDKASAWLRDGDGSWVRVGLAGIPGGFLQAGEVIRGVPHLFVFDGKRTRLYASTDLATWVEVDTPVLSQISSVAVFGDRVVLIGDKGPVGMGTGNPGVFVADLLPR